MTPESPSPSVITIDCLYGGPEQAAVYLLVESGHAAFVDNNTTRAVPHLLEALRGHGLGPGAVRYIVVTHLHLDHAGGTATLAGQCPNAVILAHPRGVRHLADPTRLVADARQVYGARGFERLYGEIRPIREDRIRGVEDNERLAFGSRTLTFLHTRGHANHHICIHDSATNGVFTGDAFGVGRSPSVPMRKPLLLCSSAPADFDPEEARRSVYRIVDTGADRVYLAHFGELTEVSAGKEVLLDSIRRMASILADAVAAHCSGETLERFCEERIRASVHEQADDCGAELSETDWQHIETDIRIHAQGMAWTARKRIKAAAQSA